MEDTHQDVQSEETKSPDSNPIMIAARNIILQHIHTLAIERRSRLVADKYGVVDSSSWDSEVEYFLEAVVFPHLEDTIGSEEFRRSAISLLGGTNQEEWEIDANDLRIQLNLRELVEEELTAYQQKRLSDDAFQTEYATSDDFEEWCAATLRNSGWDAQVTGQAGDQGVDVRASKDGIILVVQCKFYTQPVGNSAVQEVFAGKSFYRADHAAVVSTAGFTKSARAIAAQTSVFLLTPGHLKDFTPTDLKL